MSALTLTLRQLPLGRLDLSPLLPALTEGGPAALAALPLTIGNRRLPLAELFTVSGEDPLDLVLEGDLSRVDGIGAGLQAGRLHVAGAAGNFLGHEMNGGEIRVAGAVGDFAAAAMRKGRITIAGDAGDYLGGPLPGAMKGMSGGLVVVNGSAGARCGDRLRRGAILVAGAVGDYAGTRMLAGTVLALGGCGAHAGYGMRRGTLLVRGDAAIDASFADCGTHTLPIVHLLFRSWQTLGGAFDGLAAAVHPVHRWMGDRSSDGKGEILQFDQGAT
jgi:formylmethanofuran dehydrogenase subunit C